MIIIGFYCITMILQFRWFGRPEMFTDLRPYLCLKAEQMNFSPYLAQEIILLRYADSFTYSQNTWLTLFCFVATDFFAIMIFVGIYLLNKSSNLYR